MSLLWIYVAYSGWNAATYVAEEIKQPGRTLPLALAIGTAVVAVFYVLLNVVFVYSMPMGVMKGNLQVFTLSAERMFGHQAAGIFSAFVALALLCSRRSTRWSPSGRGCITRWRAKGPFSPPPPRFTRNSGHRSLRLWRNRFWRF